MTSTDVVFEQQRARLEALAERILGRREEAEEVVQEAWLRLRSQPAQEVRTPAGWLTTVVTRLCLDELRARKRREPAGASADPRLIELEPDSSGDPEGHAVLADAVGAALLIVLDRLQPAERIAFMLHDVFDLPFDEIAPLVGRSAEATRQLASRARRRVKGVPVESPAVLGERRRLTERFLAAARQGDLQTLLQLLDPDVALNPDMAAAALPTGPGKEIAGSEQVAAYFVKQGAGAAHVALVDGRLGVIVAPQNRLLLVLQPTFRDGRIVGLAAIASAEALSRLDIALVP